MAIQILPPQEARRIAAGEVVDRPAALVREFLDNAIDSSASAIDVGIEEGGSAKVEVADDGGGMGRDDLEKCFLAHATSKIRCLDDLATAETLGFRGEALAAAAAVARLEITSGTGSGEAWRLNVGPGDLNPPCIERAGRARGSTVRALSLFDTIPARKRFLKRESSEAAQCRQIFIEKALAFPEIAFRFAQDGRNKMFLPACASKKERFAAALLEAEAAFLHEIHISGAGFSADVVIGGPELSRADRRMLYVFANGRRIQDYSLVTALEYGTQGLFPNGTHPVGAVYVDIDPALADFNIHPAKREARFRDPGAIHHAVTGGLRDFCRRLNARSAMPPLAEQALAEDAPQYREGFSPFHKGEGIKIESLDALKASALKASAGSMVAEAAPLYGGYAQPRYVGRVFDVFILAEWGERLFIIDQHAAHERILYDRFLAAPIPRQELLIPIAFASESAEDDRFLEAKMAEWARLGIAISRDGSGWQIEALPQGWALDDSATVREILALRQSPENMAERWAATLCCHQAVRDGDYIGEDAALALIQAALALPDPHCPHGRPIWAEISRDALYRSVRRI